MNAITILTVEDEFLVSEYLREVLEGAGYRVIATNNADEAIAVLESRNDIRVVITDINMPGSMDGLKLAAAIRGRWPPIKSSSPPEKANLEPKKYQCKLYSCQNRTPLPGYSLRFSTSSRDWGWSPQFTWNSFARLQWKRRPPGLLSDGLTKPKIPHQPERLRGRYNREPAERRPQI